MLVPHSWFLLLAVANIFPSGVPGGILEVEVLLSGCEVLCIGGIHKMQRLLRLGSTFNPPQAVYCRVGGGTLKTISKCRVGESAVILELKVEARVVTSSC